MLQRLIVYVAIGFVLFILIAVALFILIIASRYKKKSIAEINYDYFDRKDSLEYLKFDKVISSNPDEPLKEAGVVVIDKHTFVAGISVTGYNFFSASYDSQVNTINAMISMMGALEYPVAFRQTAKAINISHNIEEHEEAANALKEKIEDAKFKLQEFREQAEDHVDSDYEYAVKCQDEADALEKQIERLNWQYAEAREIIAYMRGISTESGDTQKVQNIIFSYTFDVSQFTAALTEEEICLTAMQELESRASSLISSLYRCGCSARRCSAEDMIELMRRHMHPATGDDDSIQDLFNSSLNSLFVTSESLLDTVRDQLTVEEYERRIAVAKEQLERINKEKELLSMRAESDRLASVRKVAATQVQI